MNVNEIYKSYLIKINTNDTNKNIKVNEGVFVKVFNEQSKVWLQNEIKEDSSDFSKNRVSDLLVFDSSLKINKLTTNYTEFVLPEDYFDYTSSYSIADKGECKNRVLLNWDFKVKNRNSLFQNSNFSPSFDYEETLVNISRNNLLVFVDGFSVTATYLTYYSTPVEIEIAGYIKENGETTTKNIGTNLSDTFINEIINMSVIETIRVFGNPDGFELAKDRLTKK